MSCHLVLALGSVTLLQACVPIVESYYRLEREDAKYFGGICNGNVGAPSVIYFPYEGIFLSASANEKPGSILLGVHIPNGRNVQLLERYTTMSYTDNQGEVVRAPLNPAPDRSGNSDPHEFRVVTSPYQKEDYFGLLNGDSGIRKLLFASDVIGHKTYRFEAQFEGKPATGTVTFPAMRIDGQTFSGPRIPFRRTSYFSIYPINC